ncbi:aldose 1-epimerase [Nocardioides terrae]|uniref:Aldose 1-epimerase n=1 Tax=Nocardioides terrae TaxID=574651 RepID=A0A1I1M1Y6_9ACTN|nr:aldose 1-epimerase family protein [Nocardioides terrae]SFC79391.1 aldose 1-epimerase [Nocardioides terrae]
MLPPSGQQFVISSGDYEAVVTESGGALRALSHAGRPLIDGFEEDAAASGGRGQLLMPWPNRVRDGRYAFEGVSQQLALSEPARHNASHGLVRWAAWSLVAHRPDHVTLTYRLMSQTGYPWTLDLEVGYALGPDGLTVTQSATNRAGTTAPYASGAHPYLRAGAGPVDGWTVELPASVRILTDAERLLPVDTEGVEGTPYDLRAPRPLGDLVLNHAYGRLARDEHGRTTTRLRAPEGTGVELWVDEHHDWLMVYTADDVPATARRSLAVEPMTAPIDAFNSGVDLVRLEPGQRFSASWGVRAS